MIKYTFPTHFKNPNPLDSYQSFIRENQGLFTIPRSLKLIKEHGENPPNKKVTLSNAPSSSETIDSADLTASNVVKKKLKASDTPPEKTAWNKKTTILSRGIDLKLEGTKLAEAIAEVHSPASKTTEAYERLTKHYNRTFLHFRAEETTPKQSWDNTAFVILIPTRKEYFDANINNDIWNLDLTYRFAIEKIKQLNKSLQKNPSTEKKEKIEKKLEALNNHIKKPHLYTEYLKETYDILIFRRHVSNKEIPLNVSSLTLIDEINPKFTDKEIQDFIEQDLN